MKPFTVCIIVFFIVFVIVFLVLESFGGIEDMNAIVAFGAGIGVAYFVALYQKEHR